MRWQTEGQTGGNQTVEGFMLRSERILLPLVRSQEKDNVIYYKKRPMLNRRRASLSDPYLVAAWIFSVSVSDPIALPLNWT